MRGRNSWPKFIRNKLSHINWRRIPCSAFSKPCKAHIAANHLIQSGNHSKTVQSLTCPCSLLWPVCTLLIRLGWVTAHGWGYWPVPSPIWPEANQLSGLQVVVCQCIMNKPRNIPCLCVFNSSKTTYPQNNCLQQSVHTSQNAPNGNASPINRLIGANGFHRDTKDLLVIKVNT